MEKSSDDSVSGIGLMSNKGKEQMMQGCVHLEPRGCLWSIHVAGWFNT